MRYSKEDIYRTIGATTGIVCRKYGINKQISSDVIIDEITPYMDEVFKHLRINKWWYRLGMWIKKEFTACKDFYCEKDIEIYSEEDENLSK